MKRLHRHIAPVVLVMMTIVTVLAGCCRKDLYLAPRGNVEMTVTSNVFDYEILWGTEWHIDWQYPWDEELYGPMGYTLPTGLHAIAYQLDDNQQRVRKYYDRHLDADGGHLNLGTNAWYDVLLYNDDTEWILFPDRDAVHDSVYATFGATTRTTTKAQYTRTRTHAGYNQPDLLYGSLISNLHVSEDLNDYEEQRAEDGTIIYVRKVETTLHPYTYIYLYQVMLLNNSDAEGTIVTSGTGLTANGLASGVDLFSRRTHSTVVSLTQENMMPLAQDVPLTLPDGTDTQGDILAARIQTWGMPDIVPHEELTRSESTEPADSTFVGVGLRLRNGYTYVMQKNVTEQMKERPAGGVITFVVDVAREIPDSIINHKGGGGFQATVNQWDNETRVEIQI